MRRVRIRAWRCHHLKSTNKPSAAASNNAPQVPSAWMVASTSSMAVAKTVPSINATPVQMAAPAASNARNCTRGVPTVPANVLASDANPGMNLAISSEGAPQRE